MMSKYLGFGEDFSIPPSYVRRYSAVAAVSNNARMEDDISTSKPMKHLMWKDRRMDARGGG